MEREELLKLKVTELRDIAEQHEVVGASGKTKEELQTILAEKLGIDLHDHVAAGIGRATLKVRIRELKTKRDEALSAGNREAFLKARSQLKHFRRRLRKVIAQALRQAKHAQGAPS